MGRLYVSVMFEGSCQCHPVAQVNDGMRKTEHRQRQIGDIAGKLRIQNSVTSTTIPSSTTL